MESIVDFFKNLPPKTCTECGEPIEEQHECYGNKCDKCLGVYPIKENEAIMNVDSSITN